jgi:hypothetical protein
VSKEQRTIMRARAICRMAREPAPPAPPLTQDVVDRLPQFARDIGLTCGALVETPDGKVVLANVPKEKTDE